VSEIPEFEIRDSENFRIVYTMGAFGGIIPNDARMILYVDRIRTRPVKGKFTIEKVGKIVRERQVEIHLSPETWKSMARWKQKSLEDFEKSFGEIPEAPKGKKGKKRHSAMNG